MVGENKKECSDNVITLWNKESKRGVSLLTENSKDVKLDSE
jgi:hypothetical protein